MIAAAQEVRLAIRMLGNAPGFTVIAVITLALGIGAATSIFTVADAVLLRSLPYPAADRLVSIYSADPKEGDREPLSGPDFLDIQAAGASFEQVAAYRRLDFNLVGGEVPLQVNGASVTPNFFSLLGVDALVGRVLSPVVDTPESQPAVVLGHGLWQARFGGRADILGEGIRLNDELYTIVGVMPPGFAFPREVALWTAPRYRVPDPPFDMGGDPAGLRDSEYLSMVGRLREGTTLEAARAEMSGLAERLAEEYPSAYGEGIAVVSLHDDIVGDARPRLLLLLGAVGFLLLVACANVANLLLVRAARREREMAVRLALGAGRLRIMRLLLTESTVLAVCGGALGFLLALWGTEALLAVAPGGLPRIEEIHIDQRALGFSSLVVLGTGLVFGMAPLPLVLGQDLRAATNAGGGGSTTRKARNRLRRGLIVAELAVSFVLLVGAGLLFRTFTTLVDVDPGFDPRDTLVAHITLPESRYAEEHEIRGFIRRVIEGVEALPGVDSAGTVLTLPMSWNARATLTLDLEGRPAGPGEKRMAGLQVVSPGYLDTLRIPLRQGRRLTEGDDENAAAVAMVNETFVRTHWPGEDAVGRRFTWGHAEPEEVEWVRVVGVVGDTRIDGVDRPPVAEVYQPYTQVPLNFTTLVVRSRVEPAALQAAVRRVVSGIDPGQPLHGVASMEQVLAESLGERRFTATLLTLFAAVALLMAGVGLYGVLSYSVAQRWREIGIRRALGAQRVAVVGHVVREGAWLTLLGLAIGAVGGLGLTRFVASQIQGVGVTDPVSYGLGALVLGGAALVSCVTPAVRASRVEPSVILRAE